MNFHLNTRRRIGATRLSIACPQCTAPLYMPEWSEYLSATRVRHLWECEACACRFETYVRFREESVAA